jgi:hypothetical protein
MKPEADRNGSPASLKLKLGDWLEAHATGWGVAAIPAILVILLAAAALKGSVLAVLAS